MAGWTVVVLMQNPATGWSSIMVVTAHVAHSERLRLTQRTSGVQCGGSTYIGLPFTVPLCVDMGTVWSNITHHGRLVSSLKRRVLLLKKWHNVCPPIQFHTNTHSTMYNYYSLLISSMPTRTCALAGPVSYSGNGHGSRRSRCIHTQGQYPKTG